VEKIIYTSDEIKRSLIRISYEILEKNPSTKSLFIFGIETKGAIVGKRLYELISEVNKTNIKVHFQALDTKLFRDDYKVNLADQFNPSSNLDLENQVVIIVDDVLQTGRTARAAIQAVLSIGRPKVIQLATLIDRGHRELPIRPDYVGKNFPSSKDEFIEVQLEGKDSDCVILKKKIEGTTNE
jgi:pyrimidine operon attenuation protein/uracil phosphoribosyltransferase